VAYVSYNALPGGRAREALRDMLRFHAAATEDPQERIEQARALLRFLLEGWPLMRSQVEQLLSRSDAGLLHDELAPINEPVYFHEFVGHAGRYGLQYLAEADFFEMQIGVVSERVADALLAVEDPVRREQYLDFLTCATRACASRTSWAGSWSCCSTAPATGPRWPSSCGRSSPIAAIPSPRTCARAWIAAFRGSRDWRFSSAEPRVRPRGRGRTQGRAGGRGAPYLMNSISEYFGSGHRSSATMCSSRSATARVDSIAGMTVSRMYLASSRPSSAGWPALAFSRARIAS
jgi:hypothetical protein